MALPRSPGSGKRTGEGPPFFFARPGEIRSIKPNEL